MPTYPGRLKAEQFFHHKILQLRLESGTTKREKRVLRGGEHRRAGNLPERSFSPNRWCRLEPRQKLRFLRGELFVRDDSFVHQLAQPFDGGEHVSPGLDGAARGGAKLAEMGAGAAAMD